MRCSYIRTFIILSIWAFPFIGNAQTFESPKTKKLQIGISTSQYSFFDENPVIQDGYNSWFYTLLQTRGYEAIYFNTKHGIRLSYNKVKINYLLFITHPRPIGSIHERGYILYNLEYLRKVYAFKKIELHLSGGMTYRKGGRICNYSLWFLRSFY